MADKQKKKWTGKRISLTVLCVVLALLLAVAIAAPTVFFVLNRLFALADKLLQKRKK